jgi:hypothetical protein
MSYPRFQRARSFKYDTRTAGNIALTNTAWADLTSSMDIVLAAQAGDVIEYGISGMWGSEATYGYLDIGTVVSGSTVNQFINSQNGASSTSEGALCWVGLTGELSPIGGSVMYALQSGDIASGTVTLRPRVRLLASTTKNLWASTTDPLHVWAKNLGPADPH